MKSWEVVKALSENPKRKFICKGVVAENISGDLVLSKEGVEFGFCVNDEWEEIKEPVDFMTAINSGKRIKPAGSTGNFMTIKSLSGYMLGSKYKSEEDRIELINGKWIIEE